MSKIFLTSDTHFFHNKDFIYAARGFASVEEMNAAIVKNWNSVVKPEDTAYMLGDVMMGSDIQAALKLVEQLNGKKYLAFGNHDTSVRLDAFLASGLFEDIQMGYRFPYKKRTCILTHYPTNVANANDTKTVNFFGHTHQQTNFFENKWFMYHVGMDSHNCTPVDIDVALEAMQKQRTWNEVSTMA